MPMMMMMMMIIIIIIIIIINVGYVKKKREGTIDHLTSGWSILEKE
jgi:uncharacterized protein YoxC